MQQEDISLNDLKAMLPQEGSSAEQEAALRALSVPPHGALGQKGKAAPSLPPGCAERKFFAS